MSDQPGIVDQSQITDTSNTDTGTDGGNPAWQEFYEVLPTNLHHAVRPVLEKWDKGTQEKFTEYSTQLKQYEPYKEFVDNQVPVDQIEQALQVAALIDSDPQGFMAQMQAIFGEQTPPPQGQQANQPQQQTEPNDQGVFDEQPFNLENDPRFKQLAEQQDIIANFLATQAQTQEQQQADQMLDTELTTLTEKYGEFDERYVITLGASGMDLEEAVKQYQEIVGAAKNTPRADANVPNILSPGGGVPSEQVDVASLSVNDRKALVMNYLAQAAQNKG